LEKYLSLILGVYLLISSPVLNAAGQPVGLWGRFETSVIKNNNYDNPFQDVILNATFISPSKKTYNFFGFYDGNGISGQKGNIWKLRFMPNEVGMWSYKCSFSDGTAGKKGRFECSLTGAKPGPLRKDPIDGRWLKFADGTRFYPRSYYASEIFTGTSPYGENIIGTFFGGTYKYNLCCTIFWQGRTLEQNGWNNLPYNGFYPTIDGDYTKLNLVAWRHVDKVLERLESHETVWWNFDGFVPNVGGDMGAQMLNFEAQKVYARNVVARIGPYWNVIWNIAFEWDEQRCFGNNPAAVKRLAEYIKSIDPWKHFVTVHDEAYYTTGEDIVSQLGVDFPVLQSDMGRSSNSAANSKKMQQFSDNWPVYAQEVCWEGTGKLNAEQVRSGGWGVVLGGGILNYAEQFGGPNSGRPENFGDGSALPYIEIMFDFMESIPYYEMMPHNELVSGGAICFADIGRIYIIYVPPGNDSNDIELKNVYSKDYKAVWFNPRSGQYSDITKGPAGDGRWLLPARPSPGNDDWIVVVRKVQTANR